MTKGDRKIALAVCGSIAAYKAVMVARELVGHGVAVTPVMTESATHFVGPLTLSGICGRAVVRDMFDARYAGEVHVDLGQNVDLVLIAPATADVLARLAAGRADDIVTALALSAKCPVLAAPAMHTRMWQHPATQRNVATLRADGRVKLVGPVDGPLASGESGMGRLAEPDAIVTAALLLLAGQRDLAGFRLVVTAGPTVEDLDPVRFLSNRSTGRMGFALAERAAERGAQVTLVTGPVELATPAGVTRIDVRGAREMKTALESTLGPGLGGADALVMSAAVADYAPREPYAHKLKKAGDTMSLELVKNPDLLADLGAARSGARPVLVGFAVETAEPDVLVAYAQKKLREKRVDLVVANHAADSFARDTNRATFVTENAADALPLMSKNDLADQILDRVRSLFAARGIQPC
ncbi:MAG TPA: bifunctional phosphopantothenoylcysteine decarboxylase/phosphopantothenate--cysteine ligase CoaBC [Polyangiaceae bacterium]|nr:bifunctional phosphopantothenoylcysteine decarboxylase/phosphopantothenate--cysteine ligase CoaBC [Polyangiaceae bacterium]